MRILFTIALGAGLAGSGLSQTVVEHAVITGAGSTGAAAGAGVGKSAGGVFEGVNKALGSAKNEAPAAPVQAQPRTRYAAEPAASLVPREKFEPQPVDPSQIATGMDRGDLIAKCGKPSMRTAQTRNFALVENFWYYTAAHEAVVVTLRDGAVASVKGPERPAAR